MKLMLMLFSTYIYLISLLSFMMNRKHLLLMLMMLESLVLIMYLILLSYLSFFSFEFFMVLIFLTVSVCEGVLGLSILISLLRTHGNDYFQSFSILW